MKKLNGILASICSFSLISGNLSHASRIVTPFHSSNSFTYLKRRSKKRKKRKHQSWKLKLITNKDTKEYHHKNTNDVKAVRRPVRLDKNRIKFKNKPKTKNTYFENLKKRLSSYLKKHPKEVDLAKKIAGYGALSLAGAGATTLSANQWIRLNILYKIADQNAEKMKHGKGSSSVKEYEYRDEKKKDKRLVIKKINYLSLGIPAFGSEKRARNIILGLGKNKKSKTKDGSTSSSSNTINEISVTCAENILDHFTLVEDYHYGLTSAFVVYNKANKHDWKKEMLDDSWSKNDKANWLVKVFTQVLDCSEFLYENGLLHGDLNCPNYNVDKVSAEPYVRIFDYGLLHRVEKNPFVRQSLNWELEKILKGFIIQYCYYFDLGGVNDLIGDQFFDLIKRNDINDNNFKQLVTMYNKIRETYKTLGNTIIGLNQNFDEKEYKDKMSEIRQFVQQMSNEFSNQQNTIS